MDSKQLLVKTVEAVGDVELRKDHERLQSFQTNQGKSELELRKNENVLNDLRGTLEGLEEEMKEYKRKKELEAKLLLLQQKQQWYLVSERRITANEERQKRDDQMLHVQDLETKMAPKVNS